MKKICLALFLVFASVTMSSSQILFSENFNYPVKDTLDDIGGWNSSNNSNSFIKVTSSGLTYPGYISSGIGNCVSFANLPNSSLSVNNFGNENSGTIYMSYMIRVDSLATGATEGSVISLDEAGGATNNNTYLFVKKLTSSTFNFGIRKYNGVTVYSQTIYNINITYIIIVNREFKPGDFNDVAKLYVFTSGVPATEPAVPSAIDTVGYDVNNIGEVTIQNSYIGSGLNGSSMKLDGIRIGKSWNSTLFQNYVCQLSMKAYIQGFYNNVTNKMVKDTVTVSLRYNRPPYSISETRKSVLDSNGNGTFNFTKIGNYAPYFIQVDHRNTLESWSKLAKEFEDQLLTYDFAAHPNFTYGNNVIQKGSKYCFYSGEIVHDGIIDVTDYQFVDNNAFLFAAGYKTTDLNGDNLTDIEDLAIVELNAYNFVQVMKP
ncbi:MAG: hypothetical protein WAT71_13245 [Ignavibacteria bacterium]